MRCAVANCGVTRALTLYAESLVTCLDEWNASLAADAITAVLPCCASRAWAAALVARRPLGTLPEVLAASDSAWWSVSPDDWKEAFAAHPRLGEVHAASATPQSLAWSRNEQSALQSEENLLAQIGENNRRYEQRFGRVFLLHAAGRTAAEVLAIQQRRLQNTPEAELQESAEQQREITHGRLQRWLRENDDAAGTQNA